MNPKIEIRKGVAQVKKQTIAYVLDQIPFWVQIPYWALQANGRTGWSEAYKAAYALGRWQVFDDRSVFVDLKTGRIVDLSSAIITDTETILRVASDLECVDARTILARLKIEARQKHASYMDVRNVTDIRNDCQKLYGVVRVK
jgi:hypothetical protein